MKIIPVNNKVLLEVEKEKEVENKGGFMVVKTRKDSLLRGTVIGGHGYTPGVVVYFAAYGYEEVDGKVLIDADQIWAYERAADKEDRGE